LALSNLVAKSLVSSSTLAQSTHFWLLGATRAFASQMLGGSGESPSVERRHALFFCELLENLYAARPGASREPCSEHAAYLTNIRSALEWAHGQKDDVRLMSRLAAAAGPFLLDLSLLNDCIRWAEIGLETLEDGQRGRSEELELHASLGLSLFFGRGSLEQARVSLLRALQLAEVQQDEHNQMRLLGALNIFHHRTCDLLGALRLAQRAQTVARSSVDPACLVMADWLLGISAHLVGDQLTARAICERAWSRPPRSSPLGTVRFSFDEHRIRSLCSLVRALWLLGKADEARSTIPRVIEQAERFGHPIAIAIAIAGVTPVWLWAGEWNAAEDYTNRLLEHAEQHSMAIHQSLARGLQGQLAVERGHSEAGLHALLEAMDVLKAVRFELPRLEFAKPLAHALAQRGQTGHAIAVIDSALKMNEGGGESFYLPELLRVKGSLLAEYFTDRQVEAEALMRLSFEVARRRGALAWQLRAAMSLSGRRDLTFGEAQQAHRLLKDTYAHFSDGFATHDMVLARKMLRQQARSSWRREGASLAQLTR
jgi:predicted ATPase